MCHGIDLLPVITFLTVPVLDQMQFENMIRNVCEVTNMEKITLLVSVLQLVFDVAVCVGSSPTVRYHLTNIAQLVEHMAESLFKITQGTIRHILIVLFCMSSLTSTLFNDLILSNNYIISKFGKMENHQTKISFSPKNTKKASKPTGFKAFITLNCIN